MNNKEVDAKLLYVGRAQKRTERQAELKDKFDRIKQVMQQRNCILVGYSEMFDIVVCDCKIVLFDLHKQVIQQRNCILVRYCSMFSIVVSDCELCF